MQTALTKLKEDIYHLSPLLHEHINFVGKYNFHSEVEPNSAKLHPLNASKYSQENRNVRI